MKLANTPAIVFPATLVFFVIGLGLSGFHAEDDPNETYLYDRTESVLQISLEAPGGTTLSSSGGAASLDIRVNRHSWEIWRKPSSGIEEYREATQVPEFGANINLSLSNGMGNLGDTMVSTNAEGYAATTFTPDNRIGSVAVNATVENSSASVVFQVSNQTGEIGTFSYSRTEATLVAELTARVRQTLCTRERNALSRFQFVTRLGTL